MRVRLRVLLRIRPTRTGHEGFRVVGLLGRNSGGLLNKEVWFVWAPSFMGTPVRGVIGILWWTCEFAALRVE